MKNQQPELIHATEQVKNVDTFQFDLEPIRGYPELQVAANVHSDQRIIIRPS